MIAYFQCQVLFLGRVHKVSDSKYFKYETILTIPEVFWNQCELFDTQVLFLAFEMVSGIVQVIHFKLETTVVNWVFQAPVHYKYVQLF